jgi:hypothetical protein
MPLTAEIMHFFLKKCLQAALTVRAELTQKETRIWDRLVALLDECQAEFLASLVLWGFCICTGLER